MRILRNAHVKTLHHQYQKQGNVGCPECGTSLRVITIPQFKANGRMSHATFSVVCQACGVSGAVENRFQPDRA
jgi:transcription elongation factor Elf1